MSLSKATLAICRNGLKLPLVCPDKGWYGLESSCLVEVRSGGEWGEWGEWVRIAIRAPKILPIPKILPPL
jgi:hypothetical protein